MGCIQSSEGKSQDQRETVSGRNKYHVKTEGLITTFCDTQRSTSTRHPEEDSSEGNGSHMGTCRYDDSPDSDNEEGHSPNLSFSPDTSMQMNDDEAHPHDKQIQSRGRGHELENFSSSEDDFLYRSIIDVRDMSDITQTSHRNYSTGDSDEDIRYKKITLEGILPNPRPNRPTAPPAPAPPDHLDRCTCS